jgi:hypothetical protein
MPGHAPSNRESSAGVRQLPMRTHRSRPVSLARVGEVEEVLILRDDDAAFRGSALPDVDIRRSIELEVENMNGICAARGKPAGERRGELMVHKELHAPVRTT